MHTAAGAAAAYDALIVCVGATARVVYEHALTLTGGASGELDGYVADLQAGQIGRVAFVAHDRPSWPLPRTRRADATSIASWPSPSWWGRTYAACRASAMALSRPITTAVSAAKATCSPRATPPTSRFKHGGLGAQQADVVARAVAALAGAPVSPLPFHPKLEGLLVTGGVARYLSTQLVGGHAFGSAVRADWPRAAQPKIAAAHLNELLDPRRAAPR